MGEWHEVLKRLSFAERKLLKAEGVKGRYTRKKIDLSGALNNEELRVDGDTISIAKIVGTSSLKIKLDNRHAKDIDLREVREIYSPYGNIYITTDGAGGAGSYAILYFGGDLTARIKPFENKVSQRNTAGTDVDLLTQATFESEMDALQWTGTPYSTPITSTNAVQKFEAASERLRDVVIRNTHASYEVDIGVYHATPATFRAASFELAAGASIGFKEIDLTLLGIISSTDGEHAVVHVLGVTE